MNNDMALVNQLFRSLKDELKGQKTSIDAIRAKMDVASSAFAPRIYATLAEANTAMLIDGVYYDRYAFAIIGNVRDIGEGAGAGKGALCVWKPSPPVVTAAWYRLDNTVAVI